MKMSTPTPKTRPTHPGEGVFHLKIKGKVRSNPTDPRTLAIDTPFPVRIAMIDLDDIGENSFTLVVRFVAEDLPPEDFQKLEEFRDTVVGPALRERIQFLLGSDILARKFCDCRDRVF